KVEPLAEVPPLPKRRIVIVPKIEPSPPARAPRKRTLPKGQIFDPKGGLTDQGVTQVRAKTGNRNLTPGQANMEAAGDPAVLEHLVKEHFRRAVNRGEISGKVVAGGKNMREYARELSIKDPKGTLNLDQSTQEFLKQPENVRLREELIRRLTMLRDELGMP